MSRPYVVSKGAAADLRDIIRYPLVWRLPMNAVVFEHVPVAELPEKWRARLTKTGAALVTVRIEEEAPPASAEEFTTDDPAFGIWRDCEYTADVAAYVRKITSRATTGVVPATSLDDAGRHRRADLAYA